MGFEKGHTKQGGRQAGTPNKISEPMRTMVNAFLAEKFEEVTKCWEDAADRDKLSFYVQMLRFGLPQLQSIEMQSELESLPDHQLEYLLNSMKAEMLLNMKSN